ncbi:MAG: hypothetical protein K2R98_19455 [Gemmataceae bacterium]|nr:hypothetical protein [Gemmataceae bacterium]
MILVTVHRRYHELAHNLEKTWELAGEFAERPEVVVVWADPEVGHLWFFQELLAKGLIHHLVERPPLPCKSVRNTTYPESHNLRLGLEFIRDHYRDAYVLTQIADIEPRPGVYKFVDKHMAVGENKAVLFHWPNPSVSGCWHTNFFAVATDEAYWPPVSTTDNADVLEHQWGQKFARNSLPGVVQTNNFFNRFFLHSHLSEGQPAWPVFPQAGSCGVSLSVRGHLSWRQKVRGWLQWCSSKWRAFNNGKD